MKNTNKYPIDFVVLWVDGADREWVKKRNMFSSNKKDDYNEARYRDWGTLKYWFRGVEKYAPWVNHIYLVTDSQVPEWLNLNNPKVSIVDHTDIIDNSYLPTFNSQAIEVNIHKIPGLSEHFVYFNDDMFLINETNETVFFKDGVPVEIANINAATGMNGDQLYAKTMFNNTLLINRHFNKKKVLQGHLFKWINVKYGSINIRTISQLIYPFFTGYKPQHMPTPLLKSTFDTIWKNEKEVLEATSSHKFRHPEDVNQNVFTEWQLCENRFVPGSKSNGHYYRLGLDSIDKITNGILKSSYKYVCINDNFSNNNSADDFILLKNQLIDAFESKLNAASSFERKKKI